MAATDESRLKQWLLKYQNPDLAFQDIMTVLNAYPGLQPYQEIYTFNDGTPMDLVNLSGTIPVHYKGSVYNIPICIWLMDTHPKNAPMCYVKPTSDMSIKVSIFVDQNGKIYLPYLHDWMPNSSDLIGLIQVMICTFGEQPPVFAKPKDSGVPYPSNAYMPPSVGGGPSGFMPYPPGPYPTPGYGGGGGGYPPYPSPAHYSAAGGGGSNPPYPPYPPGSGMPATSSSSSSYGPYPSHYPPYPPPGPLSSGGGGTGTIKDEHIRESLLTAIEEKLLRRMKEQYQQNQAELETLKRTQEELKQGKVKLDGILTRLAKEQSDLEKNIAVLKEKERELDSAIERLNDQETIDVDDAVITTAPLYKQLLNAYAEEAALEDAIYYMGEALRCGVIDLEVFLRQVRTLSRKQFMLRALMHKCRQKAGLPV